MNTQLTNENSFWITFDLLTHLILDLPYVVFNAPYLVLNSSYLVFNWELGWSITVGTKPRINSDDNYAS